MWCVADRFGEVYCFYSSKKKFGGHCINIREIKFSDKRFVISKSYAQALERKMRVFRALSGRRQTLFLTLITPLGIVPNRYSEELVANEVVLSDLLRT